VQMTGKCPLVSTSIKVTTIGVTVPTIEAARATTTAITVITIVTTTPFEMMTPFEMIPHWKWTMTMTRLMTATHQHR